MEYLLDHGLRKEKDLPTVPYMQFPQVLTLDPDHSDIGATGDHLA